MRRFVTFCLVKGRQGARVPRVGNVGKLLEANSRSDRSFSYDRGVRTMPWAWHVRTRPYISS